MVGVFESVAMPPSLPLSADETEDAVGQYDEHRSAVITSNQYYYGHPVNALVS